MTSLVEHFEAATRASRLAGDGDSILLGVSGGLDSMVLLHLFHELAAEHRWRLAAAHFNHQLRGKEGDADEELVRRTAAEYGIKFVAGRADVRRHALEQKVSLEMAGRELRHGFFARTALDLGLSKVALAHHAGDQVELFLLRLLRGAGGAGLSAMRWTAPSPADPRVTLIRPLLDVSKATLLEHATRHGIPFNEDCTNAQREHERNKIRHELIPLLAREYQPAIARIVLRSAEILGAEGDFAEEAAREWLERRAAAFESLHPAVQRRALRAQLFALGIEPDFDLVEHLRTKTETPVEAAQGVCVYRDEEGLVRVREREEFEFDSSEVRLDFRPGTGEAEFGGLRIHWSVQSCAGGTGEWRRSIEKAGAGCEVFDVDQVGGIARLRHWRAGDRFQPLGMKSAVKLQDLFMNQKVPRAERHGRVIATTGDGEPFWVEGLRIGERFKVTEATRNLLVWTWSRLR